MKPWLRVHGYTRTVAVVEEETLTGVGGAEFLADGCDASPSSLAGRW